jgi:hypothetical protein
MTESWETSPEKWKKAFDEYKNRVESQKKPAKNDCERLLRLI